MHRCTKVLVAAFATAATATTLISCGEPGSGASDTSDVGADSVAPPPPPPGSADVVFFFFHRQGGDDVEFMVSRNTVAGDAYHAFLAEASAAAGGRDPIAIAIDHVSIRLGEDSQSVTSFEDFLSQQFQIALGINLVQNGSFLGGTSLGELYRNDFVGQGAGPITLVADLSVGDLWNSQAGLLRGEFMLRMWGVAEREDSPAGYRANIEVTIRFRATFDTAEAGAQGSDCEQLRESGTAASVPAQGQNCDLSGADFAGLNLVAMIFDGSNLSGADLSSAQMYITSLVGADLTDANLAGANLHGANLRSANLLGADLGSANLLDVNWIGTTCPDGVVADGVTWVCD